MNVFIATHEHFSYPRGIAPGILEAFADKSCRYTVYRKSFVEVPSVTPVDSIENWQGDAVIVCSRMDHRPAEIRLIAELSIPVVNCSGYPLTRREVTIGNDDQETGRQGAWCLINAQYQNFAYVGYRDIPWSDTRHHAFSSEIDDDSAVHTYQLPRKEVPFYDNYDHLIHGIIPWLLQLPKPIGVFCANDFIGNFVVNACRKVGIDIPKEAGILSVDNDEVICNLLSPRLTSIPLNLAEIGRTAAEKAMQLIDASGSKATSGVVPPLPVCYRESIELKSRYSPYVNLAKLRIDRQAFQDVTIQEIIRDIPLSKRSLEVKFLNEIGHSMQHERILQRLYKAKDFLARTNVPLRYIARQTHFSNTGHLCNSFKREFRLTPTEFRTKCAEADG